MLLEVGLEQRRGRLPGRDGQVQPTRVGVDVAAVRDLVEGTEDLRCEQPDVLTDDVGESRIAAHRPPHTAGDWRKPKRDVAQRSVRACAHNARRVCVGAFVTCAIFPARCGWRTRRVGWRTRRVGWRTLDAWDLVQYVLEKHGHVEHNVVEALLRRHGAHYPVHSLVKLGGVARNLWRVGRRRDVHTSRRLQRGPGWVARGTRPARRRKEPQALPSRGSRPRRPRTRRRAAKCSS
jgi:hypothetical protein